MNIAEFDHLPTPEKRRLLQQCCGSTKWVNKMIETLPAEDLIDLIEYAESTWYQCNEDDWREAFLHHPEIGDLNALKEKFTDTATLAADEQSGVDESSDTILAELSDANKRYKEKFGYIFITSATGKSAEQMLTELRARLGNTEEIEIKNAMDEQNKITRLRIEKLFV